MDADQKFATAIGFDSRMRALQALYQRRASSHPATCSWMWEGYIKPGDDIVEATTPAT
jgi:hypothetical protein